MPTLRFVIDEAMLKFRLLLTSSASSVSIPSDSHTRRSSHDRRHSRLLWPATTASFAIPLQLARRLRSCHIAE